MMAGKLLSEFLEEEQEPFMLDDYMQEFRQQLKRSYSSVSNSTSSRLCRSTCILSLSETSDKTVSPPIEQLHRPNKHSDAILLHTPARTASMLFEAALRIQNRSVDTDWKLRPRKMSKALRFFSYFRRRLACPKKMAYGDARRRSRSGEDFVSFENCFLEYCFHLFSRKGCSGGFISPDIARDRQDTQGCGRDEQRFPFSTVGLEFINDQRDETVVADGSKILERAQQHLWETLRKFEQLEGLDVEEEDGYGESVGEDEERDRTESDEDSVGRLWERAWRQVEICSMDPMVEREAWKTPHGWDEKQEEIIHGLAMEIERGIFWVLVEELAEDVIFS